MRYDNSQYEEIIDVPLLLSGAIRKWKWLAAAVIIGVLLFGGYKIVGFGGDSNEKKIEDQQEVIDATLALLRTNARDIAAQERNIAANQKKIAANEETLVTQRESLAAMEEMRATLNEALALANEIISDSASSAEQKAAAGEQLSSLSKEIADVNGQINSAVRLIRTTEDEITTWTLDIESAKVRIETLTEAGDLLRTQLEEQEADMDAIISDAGLRSTVIFAAVGGVLGGLVFCMVIFLQYIYCKKLRTAGELERQYDLHILGQFRSSQQKPHGKLGQRLDRMAGDIQTLPEEEQVYELIAAGIRASVSSLPVRLAVTGTVNENMLRMVGEKIGAFLSDGYEITVAANPVYNARFLSDIKEYTVLLVEAKDVSDRREIDKLAETLCHSGVSVIGAVVK